MLSRGYPIRILFHETQNYFFAAGLFLYSESACLDQVDQENQDFSRKKCYLVKIFGGWGAELCELAYGEIFDNILELIFLEKCLDLRLFGKVISKLKRWYIQENFVKDNFFKKNCLDCYLFKGEEDYFW